MQKKVRRKWRRAMLRATDSRKRCSRAWTIFNSHDPFTYYNIILNFDKWKLLLTNYQPYCLNFTLGSNYWQLLMVNSPEVCNLWWPKPNLIRAKCVTNGMNYAIADIKETFVVKVKYTLVQSKIKIHRTIFYSD